MAVSAIVRLVDNMSGPIGHIVSAMNIMNNEMMRASNAGDNAFNSVAVDRTREELEMTDLQMQELAKSTDKAVSKMARLDDEANEVSDSTKNIGNGMDNFTDKLSKGLNTLKNIAGVATAVKIGSEAVQLSDKMAQTEARLSLVVDDKGSVEELQQKIYQSAQRSRADYLNMADTVAGLAQRAGNAFKSNDEAIAFAENLNKQFVIAGASQQEISSASLQLTQALGGGVLRGEELNAVFEAAPNIIQTIADYMDVPIGQIRELAKDGQVTADIVKNAMLGATDNINEQFNSMSMTWAQRWTMFKNTAVMAFQPVLQKINELANSERFNLFITRMTNSVAQMAGIAVEVFDIIISIGSVMYDNWSVIGPVIIGVVFALGLASVDMLAGATFRATVAQYGLNAALLACPLVWMVGAIIAVIAIIYALNAAVNKWQGTTISAAGRIIGTFAFVGAFIWNTFIGVINGIIEFLFAGFVVPIIGVFEWIMNAFDGGFDNFGAAIANLLGQIIGWFLSLGKVVTTIIDSIFGTNWTSGLESLRSEVVKWGKNEDAFTLSEVFYNREPVLNRIEYVAAYNKGYEVGESIDEKLGNLELNGLELPEYELPEYELPEYELPEYDYTDSLGAIENNTADIANSLSSDDLKWLYDMAEREAINKFTTAEVRVEMGGVTNHLSSDMDIDGFVNKLTSKVEEALAVSVEGVHN